MKDKKCGCNEEFRIWCEKHFFEMWGIELKKLNKKKQSIKSASRTPKLVTVSSSLGVKPLTDSKCKCGFDITKFEGGGVCTKKHSIKCHCGSERDWGMHLKSCNGDKRLSSKVSKLSGSCKPIRKEEYVRT